MSAAPALRGLYAITSASLCRDPAALGAAVAAALRGGARLIQYRDKVSEPARRADTARALLQLCRTHAARLIVNDDVELARAIGADGVHVGASDLPVAAARDRLGEAAIIGTSCANRLERARAAQDDGASYVAFGRFFASATKPDAPQAEPALLRAAKQELRIPVCAIGGLTPRNAAAVVEAGADLVAAVEGVFGTGEPAAIEVAARAYARLFAQ